MVGIGGYTRLTESGLSITEWAPVTGALPPLTPHAWENAFDAYRASPEYVRLRDKNMNVDDFKRIYIPEYLHRLSGRAVGLLFFLPLFYFWGRGALSAGEKKRLLAVGALGAAQGLVGWMMVRSGLNESPYVSHFWLAFHLGMALAVFSLLWTGFLERRGGRFSFFPTECVLFAWLCLQIILGALVAGKDAGAAFGTEFPTMNGAVIPFSSFPDSITAFFYDSLALHAMHRLSGMGLCLCATGIAIVSFIKKSPRASGRVLFAAATLAQAALGAMVVTSGVSVMWALVHQLFAAVLFAFILRLFYIFNKSV